MDREQWKDRLLKAGMQAELVDDLLATLKDEDLLRMKDMTPEEIVKTLKEVVEEATEGDPPEEDGEDVGDSDPDNADDTADIASVLKEFGDGIVERIVEHLKELEITVETPDLAEITSQLKELKDEYTALTTTLKEMQGAWDEILKTDTERLRERLKDLSPAQTVRLRATLSDGKALERVTQFLHEKNQLGDGAEPPPPTNVFRTPMASPGEVIARDSDGKEYATLQDMAFGNPKP